ncbi:MAG: hypothetical protein KGV44_13345 [Flavobacteriaceae bacterium]|nr:hypothetical protein [Flavobacteriaceae bacterium]
MAVVLRDNTINKYFGFLTKLDNFTKKKLIIKLTESIEVERENKFDLQSICGAWEDGRSSDEILMDIKKSRVEKTNLIDL